MSTSHNLGLGMASDSNWDALLDSAFNVGPFERVVRANEWYIVLGMDVKLPDLFTEYKAVDKRTPDYKKKLPEDVKKVVIFADTVSVKTPTVSAIDFIGLSEVLIFARQIEGYEASAFHRHFTRTAGREEHLKDPFRLGLCVRHPAQGSDKWIINCEPSWGYPAGANVSISCTTGLTQQEISYRHESAFQVKSMPIAEASLPLPQLQALLAREWLTAQWLASEGRLPEAIELLDRATDLASSFSGQGWGDLNLCGQMTKELLQPIHPATDQVPYLSPGVYSELATSYGPALKAYADTFTNFANRAFDLNQRKSAARMILDERGDATKFQELVGKQLADNFKAAQSNTQKAQEAIATQEKRVKDAAARFKAGLDKWKEEKEREAAIAIAGAAISFVSGIASMFAGNAAGAVTAANAAQEAAKAASKLADLMKTIVKIGKVVAQVVETCVKIYAQVSKITNAKAFAEELAKISRDASTEDMKGAPSVGAYWDQMWVEVETALDPAIKQEIDGALDYLKELKILVIYGRALSTAQAAIPPLIQEMARASLQAEIATRQREAITKELDSLKSGQEAPIQALSTLWIRYRTVQRAMIVALQNFDTAYRYWALTDVPRERDTNRPIANLAGDLLQIADIKAKQKQAYEGFVPPPQSFSGETLTLPPAALAEFLDKGKIALRLAPASSPFYDRGKVGRVRVTEVYVWLDWHEGKQPVDRKVEFTVRTDGLYDDQRVEDKKLKFFHFVGTPVNLTFRYDPARYSKTAPYTSVETHAAVAEGFRAAYSEPTMFTEWQIALPQGSSGSSTILDLAAMKSAVKAIRLEFSGDFIKDPDRF